MYEKIVNILQIEKHVQGHEGQQVIFTHVLEHANGQVEKHVANVDENDCERKLHVPLESFPIIQSGALLQHSFPCVIDRINNADRTQKHDQKRYQCGVDHVHCRNNCFV